MGDNEYMKTFYLGAATAAHQVEGDNFNNDTWAQEQMKHTAYKEKSLKAANHYKTYRQDIRKMHEAGLNAYRFSLEWSRIEPQQGIYDAEAIEHYRDVIRCCRQNGIEPIITLFHFTSPKWLIEKGGWEDESVIGCFENYVRHVLKEYENEGLKYICTINEANIGVLIAKYMIMAMENQKKQGALAVGVDVQAMAEQARLQREEFMEIFHTPEPAFFVQPHTTNGIEIIKKTHKRAVEVIHQLLPDCKAGLSLSLNDLQWDSSGREEAERIWHDEFEQFTDAIIDDDYIGLQNYTRSLISSEGELSVPEGNEVTQMGYEYYPEGLANVVRRVYGILHKEILITENGIATADDSRRCDFINTAISGVMDCIKDGIDISGYLHWSLIDNYEWQSGFSMQFGMMENDENHTVKSSLKLLGSYFEQLNELYQKNADAKPR